MRSIGGYNLLEPPLGIGSHGIVYRAVHIESGRRCAVKQILPEPDTRKYIVRELTNLRKVRSPFVVEIIEEVWEEGTPYLFMEICDGGTLSRIIDSNAIVPERLAARWLSEIVVGCKAIHDSGIMHRDLKPDNILLTSTDLENAHIKIVDFGLARDGSSEISVNTASVGTALYMAPEVFSGREYSNKVDVWSFGVIANALLRGPLFADVSAIMNVLEAQKRTQDIDETCGLPPAAIQLLKATLQVDPSARPSFSQLIEMPFFSPTPILTPSTLISPASIANRLTEELLPIYHLGEYFYNDNRKTVAATLFRIYRLEAAKCIKKAVELRYYSDSMKEAMNLRKVIKKERLVELGFRPYGASVLMEEARRLIEDKSQGPQQAERLREALKLLEIGISELKQKDRPWTELRQLVKMMLLMVE